MRADFVPPVPAWAARFGGRTSAVVMAYFGSQLPAADDGAALLRMNGFFAAPEGPENVERSLYTDRAGVRTLLATAYWTDPERYRRWRAGSGYEAWWRDPARSGEEGGYFEEVLTLSPDRFETLFSTETVYGAAKAGSGLRGPIREHNYWGAMRDRIPASAGSELVSPLGDRLTRQGATETRGRRIRVTPPENLTLIRSGKDWSDCRGEELAIFEKTIRPAWMAGMDYLLKNPLDSGCVEMRATDEVGADGNVVKRSAGVGYFLTLGHLERWAESHPTHLAIFNSFIGMAMKLKEIDIRLWHEVSVLPADGQVFEYVNCHAETGLMPYFAAMEI